MFVFCFCSELSSIQLTGAVSLIKMSHKRAAFVNTQDYYFFQQVFG